MSDSFKQSKIQHYSRPVPSYFWSRSRRYVLSNYLATVLFAVFLCFLCLVTEGSAILHHESLPVDLRELAAKVDEVIQQESAANINNNHSIDASNEARVSLSSSHEHNPSIQWGRSLNTSSESSSPSSSLSDNFGASRHSKILLFPPILFESHVFVFKTLGKGLREQFGHQLTLYVSDRRQIEEDSPDFAVRRFPGIFSTEEAGVFLQKKVSNILSGKPTFLELFDILAQYSKNCDVIFTQGRESIEQLRRDKYDYLIVDPNEMCGFLMARELGIPYIVFSTGMWVPYEAYVPSPIAYVPEFNSELSDKMNFIERIKNTFIYSVSRFGTSYLIFPIYNRLITKHKIGNAKMARIIKETKSWLLCTDNALEFPRPLMPNVEYVGGIMGRPAKPLPQPLSDWADASAQQGGFIIVSFGAGVKRLDPRLESIFINVLSKLPHQVIWRYTVPLKGLGPNIKLVDWLPQNDILAHPNVRAFVGHGGTNGVYECLYHGVPVVGMPLFGDHYDSMARVHAKGIGIYASWKTLTEEKLMDAITQVVNNPKYRTSVRHYSKIHHDQPLTALQRAVHRIDYTIRYSGADHLRPEVFNLSWMQYFLIDVQIAFLVTALFIGWSIHWMMTRNAGTRPSHRPYGKKEVEFFPLTSPTSASPSVFDQYHSPSTASGLKNSGFRFLRKSSSHESPDSSSPVSKFFGCICFAPQLIYHGIGHLLLTLCVRLRLLITNVSVVNNCGGGPLRRSSRYFIKCLDAVLYGLRLVFPLYGHRNRRGSEQQQPSSTSPSSKLVGVEILSDDDNDHDIIEGQSQPSSQEFESTPSPEIEYSHHRHHSGHVNGQLITTPSVKGVGIPSSFSTGSVITRFAVDQSTTADGCSSDEYSDQSGTSLGSTTNTGHSSTNGHHHDHHIALQLPPISLIPDNSDGGSSKSNGTGIRRSNATSASSATSSSWTPPGSASSRQTNSPHHHPRGPSSPTKGRLSSLSGMSVTSPIMAMHDADVPQTLPPLSTRQSCDHYTNGHHASSPSQCYDLTSPSQQQNHYHSSFFSAPSVSTTTPSTVSSSSSSIHHETISSHDHPKPYRHYNVQHL